MAKTLNTAFAAQKYMYSELEYATRRNTDARETMCARVHQHNTNHCTNITSRPVTEDTALITQPLRVQICVVKFQCDFLLLSLDYNDFQKMFRNMNYCITVRKDSTVIV